MTPSVDLRLLHWLYAGPVAGGAWLWTMAGLTVLGSGWSLFAIVPFALPARTRRVTLRLLGALVTTALVVFALKALVGRARPCACVGDVHALVFTAPTDPSFPSGHAAGAFAFAAFLATELARRPVSSSRLRRAAFVGALFVAAAGIAISRVVLGVHFPSDVAAGTAIGAVLGAGTSWITSLERKRKGDTPRSI